jgi:hypothetical protein
MNTKLLVLFLWMYLGGYPVFPAAYITTPRVDSPQEGQALQGVVLITGSTNINGFQSAEFTFSYADSNISDEGNWFLIQYSYEPVEDGTLAVWDTSTIADGVYHLRIKVLLNDGRTRETIVPNLRVRNYTAVETSTPQADLLTKNQVTSTSTVVENVSIPTPTQLPNNTITITRQELRENLVSGGAVGIGFVVLVGLYAAIKRKYR